MRGSHPPLAWERPLVARPLGQGRYGLELRFERVPFGNRPLQYKFRIERAGQRPDEGWETGRNHVVRLEGGTRIARAFGAEPAALAWTRAGVIERLGRMPSAHVAPRPAEQGEVDAPIIVAVDSVATRVADYTPTAMTLPPQRTGTGRAETMGGGAAVYGRFLAEALPAARDLQQALMERGWDGTTLVFTEDAEGSHDEASWAGRVEGMLRFLYRRPRSTHCPPWRITP